MAKDTKETMPDTSTSPAMPDAGTTPAPASSVAPSPVQPRPAATAKPREPSCRDIVEAIKTHGAGFTQTERNEIIYTVAQLPPVSQALGPPSPYDGRTFKFQVSCGKESAEVEAKNPREAWALACDGWRMYPSPKSGKVECLGVKEAA